MICKKNGYILGVSNKTVDEESMQILEIIKNKPTPPTGHDCRLKEDLTWELFELPQSSENEPFVSDSDYSEAGKILLGVSE